MRILMAHDRVAGERVFQCVFQQGDLPVVEIAVRSEVPAQSFRLRLFDSDGFPQ